MLFENTEIAYQAKTTAQLRKAYWLFKAVSIPFLVRVGKILTLLSLKLRLPVLGLLKRTIFEQFCAGTTKEEALHCVSELTTNNVASYLHYSVEGSGDESKFEESLQYTLETFDLSKKSQQWLPFAVFKPTGIGPAIVFEKQSEKVSLNSSEKEAWECIEKRFEKICKKAASLGISVLVDAEESWFQDAIDELTEACMQKFNKEKPVVYTTAQMYRKDRLQYLEDLHKSALEKGFKIGVKLVRGAYMEKEAHRAKKMGYSNPINESKEATDRLYGNAIAFIFDNLDSFSVLLGSHNEQSMYEALALMKQKGIPKNSPHVWFAQLYGMSDHISFNLSKEGYNAIKYLPYGPVKEVVPYLMRRAEENTSVAGQTSRELILISKEQNRRKATAQKTRPIE